MKQVFLLLGTITLLIAGCSKSTDTVSVNENAAYTGRKCASNEVLEQQLAADPGLKKRMDDIERFTNRVTANPEAYRLLSDGTMEIPVIVNILYNKAQENLDSLQVKSQIDVLNEDFTSTNADFNQVPALFNSVKSTGVKVKFVLERIIRKFTSKTSWGTNDGMKKSKQGGIDATSPTTKLNIWVCSLGQNLLGYAQFPGGAASTDGVVILNTAFGSRAKYSNGYYINTYDRGRTTTHEVGHWMNLRHIWGDATCGNDFVNDTPLHNGANYGCPAYPHYSTCTGTPVEMTMNYMDYTNDACMYMFTMGQKARMEAIFAVGGPRASFR